MTTMLQEEVDIFASYLEGHADDDRVLDVEQCWRLINTIEDLRRVNARVAAEHNETWNLLAIVKVGRDAAESEMTRARSEARNAEESLKSCKNTRGVIEAERDSMRAVVSTAKVALMGLRNHGIEHQILDNLRRTIEKVTP